MSWGFIMTFHMEAARITSMSANHSLYGPCWIKLMTTLAHVIQSSSKSHAEMFLHMEMNPLMNMLQPITMKLTHMIVQSKLRELCILHFVVIYDINRHIALHKLIMFLPVVLHTIIMPLKVCKPSSLNSLHDTTWPVGGLTFQPKQDLHFLVQHGKTNRMALHCHLKMFVTQCTTRLHDTRPSDANLLNKFPWNNKKPNVYIHTPNNIGHSSFKVLKTTLVFALLLASKREHASLVPWVNIVYSK